MFRWRTFLLGLLLAGATLALYWPVRHFQYVDYDDNILVTDNEVVKSGLTWAGVKWALTTPGVAIWHPVTTLSHMLDCTLFGVQPGPAHLVNAALHALSACLLFLALRRLTGLTWRSAIVAGLFALHPLRVESVAWISERKDVLSGLFFMLTLWAWGRVVVKEEPLASSAEVGRAVPCAPPPSETAAASGSPAAGSGLPALPEARRSMLWYALALVFFTLGLMSKPMLVTLPFVLLLLDLWPLCRMRSAECEVWNENGIRSAELAVQGAEGGQNETGSALRRSSARSLNSALRTPHSALGYTAFRIPRSALIEKLPFFALSAVFSFLTFHFQSTGTAVVSMARVSIADRLANAVVSYWRYLGKFFWPTNLAAIYPHPSNPFPLVDRWAGWQIWLGALALLGVSWLVLRLDWGRGHHAGTASVGINRAGPGDPAYKSHVGRVPSRGVTSDAGYPQSAQDVPAPNGLLVRAPYLAVGWFWFLGTLVPVIGLVQVGAQAMADRYTYIPLIGITIAVVWGVADLLHLNSEGRHAREIAPSGAAATERREASGVRGIPALTKAAECAALQTLRASATACAIPAATKTAEARRTQRNPGVRFSAFFAPLRFKVLPVTLPLGALLACAAVTSHQLPYWHDTISLFEHTIEVTGDNPDAHFGLGIGLQKAGQNKRALTEYRVAVAINPELAEAHYNMGQLLRQEDDLNDAAREYEKTLQTYPDHYLAHFNLGGVYWLLGRRPEAIAQMEAALKSNPDSADALNNLAWWLAAGPDPQYRDGRRAVELAERACQLTGNTKPLMIGTLAAAYAEAGRFNDAVAAAERAQALAEQAGEKAVAEKNQELIELYRAGKAYHEPMGQKDHGTTGRQDQ